MWPVTVREAVKTPQEGSKLLGELVGSGRDLQFQRRIIQDTLLGEACLQVQLTQHPSTTYREIASLGTSERPILRLHLSGVRGVDRLSLSR